MTEQITHFGLRGDKVIPAPTNAKRTFFVGNMQINHVARASLGLPRSASFISSGVLTNGCSALAQAVLLEGIATNPPVDVVREKSRDYRQEYYEARLRPWSRYETALAYAFMDSTDGQTPTSAIVAALTTVTDRGKPVSEEIAWDVVEGVCNAGFMAERDQSINVLLPSLMKHFQEVRQRRSPNSQMIDAIRAELAV